MASFRTPPVDAMGVLIDGSNYYRELYRAMVRAEHSLVMSGWQFDTGVALLRGKDAAGAKTPVDFLHLLKHLIETRPSLRVWILAWDFHPLLAMEREWLQKLVFDWNIPDRLTFVYDSNHAPRGAHHQKFVTVDGELTFVGGMDVCEDRWDEPSHLMNNPLRLSRGEPHKPFHDVHCVMRGTEFAAAINELFIGRWDRAKGEPFDPDLLKPFGTFSTYEFENALPVPAKTVSIERTDPHRLPDNKDKPCMEILEMLVSGIESAEKLIYIETQYFSSHAIAEALERRMRDVNRPKLNIVLILNPEGESWREVLAMGLSQAQLIDRLRNVAKETQQNLGFYVTVPHCEPGEEPTRTTYIHSKVMVVDDRWLNIGSANLNNRGMGVDTELNVTVQGDEPELRAAIERVRVTLLAEHMGTEQVPPVEQLVPSLDALVNTTRLRFHPSPTEAEKTALSLVDPKLIPFDPDHVEPEEPDLLQTMGKALRQLFDQPRDNG
ncbi:MAG: phospholipase [Archangium gephyra]|uniref:Phospholipase n=1 Tax=Archangium gephyra TaxID=48 RepID=A0A2W5SZG2_9BACT|nr:MAG: phospholipase [Archangium gephyra]